MNRKVIKTMLFLVIFELLAWYILKIFMPSEFMLIVNNERLIEAGQYVDTHIWLKVICIYVTAFITYFLYLCAVCKKKKLTAIESFIVLIAISISIAIEYCLPEFITIYNIITMFGLPLIFKAEFKTTYIVFIVHGLAQILSMNIRGIPITEINFNYLTLFMLMIDGYFWLLLFYFYYNYKEENKREE